MAGFYQSDLKVYYYSALSNSRKVLDKNAYHLLWIFDSDVQFFKNGIEAVEITEPCLIPLSRQHDFRICGGNKKNSYSAVIVAFHSSAFKTIEGDSDFLRAFRNSDGKTVYKFSDFEDTSCETVMRSFDKCMMAACGRIHIFSRLTVAISELNFLYDKTGVGEDLHTATSTDVKIINYINANFAEPLSAKFMTDKFGVSYKTLNEVVKRHKDTTFAAYVDSLRLDQARRLIQNDEASAQKAAEICGYNDYSAFYRAYKKAFSVSPAKDKGINNRRKSWTLDEYNK